VKAKIAALLVLTVMVLTGCSSMSTAPDNAGLQYGSGPIEATEFATCVDPGTREWGGIFDSFYAYPAGTRTYTFDDPGDRAAIDIADKDGQPLTVAGVLTFTLNTDCNVLQQFHERIGLKYGASEDGVQQWGDLLNDYLGQPLRSAMRDAAGTYTWRELYSDPGKRTEWENRVKELLPQYVENLAQGDFFTSYTLLAQVPTPGGGLLGQIEEQNRQQERLNTIEAQKAAQQAEIEQMRQLVELLGPEGYIRYRNQLNCEQGGTCVPFMPVPEGSDLIVPAP
jgi:PAS domain-containing protein